MRLVNRLQALSRRSRRRLIAVVAVMAVAYLGFIDSHSVYKRIMLAREASRLEAENRVLQDEIERLQAELDRELSDEEIERIAREQYGMRREGETVYPVKRDD